MLPGSYELPAAIALVAGGALTCFAGYRLFRVVLAVYGFFLGAAIASSVVGVTNAVGMVVAALVGGILGALTLVFAYFVGIALVGAGLGALLAATIWSQLSTPDPPAILIVAASIAGAVSAMLLQRYVIIAATSFGGAWTLMLGVVALVEQRARGRAGGEDVWILYPTTVLDTRWALVAWVGIGLAGLAAQLGITGKPKR
jgi:hypothetical protein